MKIWIMGGAGSGKSSLAQKLAVNLAGKGKKYYIATMVPRDEEDYARIRRHIMDRKGMGFRTIERPKSLTAPADGIPADPEGTYLLDSVTAMLSNAMFGEGSFIYDPEADETVRKDLEAFSGRVRHFIAVSDLIYSDALCYDAMTDRYRQGLARICQAMAGVCDTVIECSCGIMTLHKGKLPADYEKDFYTGDWSRKMEEKRAKNLQLIIGGSGQGKTEYVRRELGIPAEKIFLCDEDNTVDMNAACLDHFERYLRGCIKRGEKPFSPRILRAGTVIICEDITCGIVPMDALDRKWREETGRYLQEAVKYGALVTRLFCGIPQILENPFQKRRDGKKEVLLLRHGMTCANEEHLYCGRLDPPLSPKGRKALEAGTNNCASGIWDAFYSSGMKRAQETLRILFGEKAAREARVCTGLREMDFGIFEGKSYEELKDTPSYQAWISGSNEKNTCPGGGSGIQMREAAVASFEKILMEESAQRIVIVTHGGPMAAIMQALFPQEDKNRYEWQSDFGKGYLLQINTDSLTGERGLQRKEVSAAYRPFPAEEERERNEK